MTQQGKSDWKTQSLGYKGAEITESHQVQVCGRVKRAGPRETQGYEKPRIMIPKLLVHCGLRRFILGVRYYVFVCFAKHRLRATPLQFTSRERNALARRI